MGIDYRFVIMVGVKGKYTDFKKYKSKTDQDYIYDIEDDGIDDYMNIVFEDNMPPDYTVYQDSMGGEYSIIGKAYVEVDEYMDEIPEFSLSFGDLGHEIDDVRCELRNMGIEFKDEDVKLYSFVHYS